MNTRTHKSDLGFPLVTLAGGALLCLMCLPIML